MSNNDPLSRDSLTTTTKTVVHLTVIHLVIVAFLGVSLVYMWMCVETAKEFERFNIHENEHIEEYFALDHFPGFRVSFIGLVISLICVEVTLVKERKSGTQVGTSLVLLIFTSGLFFSLNFYQFLHDRCGHIYSTDSNMSSSDSSEDRSELCYGVMLLYWAVALIVILIYVGRLIRLWISVGKILPGGAGILYAM